MRGESLLEWAISSCVFDLTTLAFPQSEGFFWGGYIWAYFYGGV
jgi:hypothetical protein